MRKHCKLSTSPDWKKLFGKDADVRVFKTVRYKEDNDRYCNGNILDDKNFNRYCRKNCRSLIDMGDYYECALEIAFDEDGDLTCRTREKSENEKRN